MRVATEIEVSAVESALAIDSPANGLCITEDALGPALSLGGYPYGPAYVLGTGGGTNWRVAFTKGSGYSACSPGRLCGPKVLLICCTEWHCAGESRRTQDGPRT